MAFNVKRATKAQSKLRLAIQGASGSGKTRAALVIGTALGKVCYMDTERGSASLYSDNFNFDVADMESPFQPEDFIAGLKYAEANGYDVCIMDSYSHIWAYCLDTVTKLGGSSYTAWGKVSPRLDKLISAILESKIHVICCMRSKAEYVLEEKNGKQTPRKIGMASIARADTDYEFTIVFELNAQHIASVSKDRSGLFDGKDFEITAKVASDMLGWLNSGEVIPESKTKDKSGLRVVSEPMDDDIHDPSEKEQAKDIEMGHMNDLLAALEMANKGEELAEIYRSYTDTVPEEWLVIQMKKRKSELAA